MLLAQLNATRAAANGRENHLLDGPALGEFFVGDHIELEIHLPIQGGIASDFHPFLMKIVLLESV